MRHQYTTWPNDSVEHVSERELRRQRVSPWMRRQLACSVSESVGGFRSEYTGLEFPSTLGGPSRVSRSTTSDLESIDPRVLVAGSIERHLTDNTDLRRSFKNIINTVFTELPDEDISKIIVKKSEDPEHDDLQYNEIEIIIDFESVEEWIALREEMKKIVHRYSDDESDIFFLIESPEW